MHGRIVMFLWLACAGMSSSSGLAAGRPPSIQVTGGAEEPRKLAEGSARAYMRAYPTAKLEDLVAAVGAALGSAGWGCGSIDCSIDSLASGPRIALRLDGIEPTRLAGWRWQDTTTVSPLPAGAWEPERAREQIGEMLDEVQETGRPFASIQIVGAADTVGGILVSARLSQGPEVLLASAEYEGRGATKTSYLDRVTRLRRGKAIRPSEARAARERIERTGLFRTVDGPWLRALQEDQASLVYRMTPLAQNSAEGAIGYDGARRNLSGFVHVDLGNLFGTGRRAAFSWDHYRQDRSALSLAYREPYLGPLPIAADFSLSQRLEDTTWTADQVRFGIDGDVGGGLRLRVALAGNRTIERGAVSVRTRRTDTIFGMVLDRRSGAGTAGSMFEFEVARGNLERSPHWDAGEGTLVRLVGKGERFLLVGRSGQVRLGASGGLLDGPEDLPRPDALPVGGGASLRGYPEEFFLCEWFWTATLEAGVRMLPEGNRLYVFTDVATLKTWGSGAVDHPSSYGFGVRARSGGGWVRLDYGVPGWGSPLSGRIHFRLETRF